MNTFVSTVSHRASIFEFTGSLSYQRSHGSPRATGVEVGSKPEGDPVASYEFCSSVFYIYFPVVISLQGLCLDLLSVASECSVIPVPFFESITTWAGIAKRENVVRSRGEYCHSTKFLALSLSLSTVWASRKII